MTRTKVPASVSKGGPEGVMRVRRQFSFWPSVVMSVCLNLALFAVLQPIRIQAERPPGYNLHHLTRLVVPPPVSVAAAAAPTPPLAQQARPAPPASPAAKPVGPPAAKSAPPGKPGKPGAPGAPAPASAAATSLRVGHVLTGGDGSHARPTVAAGGAGAAPTARVFEPGPAANTRLAALGGLTVPRSVPAGGGPGPLDGPTFIMPGNGAGGTPTAPVLGGAAMPGNVGSGNDPTALAPRTTAGLSAPWSPTTPGPRLREPGFGAPSLPGAHELPMAMPYSPTDHSGGGGGTANLPGWGGGGLPAEGGRPDVNLGGGGSGSPYSRAEQPGGIAFGAGAGGGGGGGNGLNPLGVGGGGPGLQPVSTPGAPSVLSLPGRGDGQGPVVRAGARAPGPGGPAADAEPGGSGKGPGGKGSGGSGPGVQNGDGGGGGGTAVAALGHGQSRGGPTGVVINMLGHSFVRGTTGSYDLVVGSVDGPRLAMVGVIWSPSVASARASDHVARDGRREPLVITVLDVKFVVGEGKGARHKVVISAADAQKLRESGLLSQPSRILTVYKYIVGQD